MADFAFLLQFLGDPEGSGAFIERHSCAADCMDQIKIKIIHTTGFQLLLEQGTDIFLLLETRGRQLVGKNVTVPGITGSQTFLNGKLALADEITVRGIEIIETVFKKQVNQLNGLRNIHFLAIHRQAHEAKTEVFSDQV